MDTTINNVTDEAMHVLACVDKAYEVCADHAVAPVQVAVPPGGVHVPIGGYVVSIFTVPDEPSWAEGALATFNEHLCVVAQAVLPVLPHHGRVAMELYALAYGGAMSRPIGNRVIHWVEAVTVCLPLAHALEQVAHAVPPPHDAGRASEILHTLSGPNYPATLFLTAPRPERRGFPLHRTQPFRTYMQTGLTDSRWADTASPAAKTLRAALMSRSWIVPHSWHVHSRTLNGIVATVCPQSEHRLLDGYQRSMPISVRPYHRALYSSCRTNSDQLASLIDFARQRFFCMLLTARLSTAITWFSFISRVESLCRKSLRASATLACSRATFRFALARRAEPFCFFASRRWNLASLASCLRNVFGAAIFSPVDRMAKCLSPRSIPTLPAASGFAETVSSHSIDTKYLPAASFDTVTVVSFAPFGSVRDQRIASGASIFASLSALPSHLKALVVYSADCGPSLRLNDGYRARLAKKLANAVCKWRNACCTGTLLTSLSQANSDSRFSFVNAAEVS